MCCCYLTRFGHSTPYPGCVFVCGQCGVVWQEQGLRIRRENTRAKGQRVLVRFNVSWRAPLGRIDIDSCFYRTVGLSTTLAADLLQIKQVGLSGCLGPCLVVCNFTRVDDGCFLRCGVAASCCEATNRSFLTWRHQASGRRLGVCGVWVWWCACCCSWWGDV